MTDEQMRIAIAEACGWKKPDDTEVMKFKVGWTSAEKWWMCPKGVLRLKHDIPDYLNDLNACAEFEAMLTDEEWLRWEATAAKMSLPRGSTPLTIWIAQMSPRQRCIAYLKTKGLIP